jgi:hypothetical protein
MRDRTPSWISARLRGHRIISTSLSFHQANCAQSRQILDPASTDTVPDVPLHPLSSPVTPDLA